MKLAAQLRAKIRKSSLTSSIDQTMLQCRCHEDRGNRTLLHNPRRCGRGKIGKLMSRVYSSSRRPIIQTERMDSWEHEDRSSFGGGSCSSSTTLRNQDHGTILIE